MSAAVEAKLLDALAGALDSYIASNPIAVAYPGLSFVPVAGVPFLRPWFLPAPTLATDWANSNDYSGIFSIDVFWPAGQGIKPAMAIAARIIDFFAGKQFAATVGTTFEKIAEDGTNTVHFAGQPPGAAVSAGTQVLFSIPAKPAERHTLTLESTDGSSTVQCEFDLAAGIAGAATGCTPAISPLGNGEFLLSISWTMLFDASTQFVAILTQTTGGSQFYTGTPGSGVFIGRAHMAIGSVAADFDMIGGVLNGASIMMTGGAPDDEPVTAQIIEPPYLSPAQQEPGWLQIPINIKYRAFAHAPGLIDMAMGATEAADTAAFSGTVA